MCVFVACGFLKGLEVVSFPSCQGCKISSINSILQKKWVKLLSTKLPSLKRTFSHPKMDGWNTVSFPFFGRAKRVYFQGANLLLVLGRVLFVKKNMVVGLPGLILSTIKKKTSWKTLWTSPYSLRFFFVVFFVFFLGKRTSFRF